MSTPVPGFIAHPLYAAVAFAHFGVPDGYVGPHDSPAAYARAVEAARCRTLYQIRAGFSRPRPRVRSRATANEHLGSFRARKGSIVACGELTLRTGLAPEPSKRDRAEARSLRQIIETRRPAAFARWVSSLFLFARISHQRVGRS
jgi:hypothetical protein